LLEEVRRIIRSTPRERLAERIEDEEPDYLLIDAENYETEVMDPIETSADQVDDITHWFERGRHACGKNWLNT
jgi:hypothetical protein